MITKALEFTCEVLDQFLKNRFALDDSRVLLNNLMDIQGNIPLTNQNKLVISLINIEKESARPYYVRQEKLANGSFSDVQLSARFNLDLLFSANFDDYRESLKFLDATIYFLQVYPVLNAASFSSIPPGLSKLEFDVEKITYHQMQGLWTSMGAKYQPSIIYKMRMITIKGDEVQGFTPAVAQTAQGVNA